MKVNVPAGVAYVIDARGVEYQIDARRQVEVDPIHAPGLKFISVDSPGKITDIRRDEQGRMTSYVECGVTWTLAYNAGGDLATATGGGVTKTFTYVDGALAGVSVQ